MRRTSWALLAFALAAFACSGNDQARVPILLEVPDEDSGLALLQDLDSLEFYVSDGQGRRTSRVYPVEDGRLPAELSLADVPVDEPITFHLIGFSLGAEVAYGRTCPIVIVEGGEPSSGERLYFARVGTFRGGAAPAVPARSHALMFSDDRGRALLAGGSDNTLVELFDPRQGVFEEAGRATIARMSGALAVRSDGTAVVAGGMDGEAMPIGRVEEILPRQGDAVRQLGPAEQPAARRTELALAALADRSVLLAGGRDAEGVIRTEVALLAAGDDEFRPAGEMVVPRAGHSASLGLGGVVYLIGGLTADELGVETPTGTIELYRPQDQSVRAVTAELAVPRVGHTATVLDDGRILIVGGLTLLDPCAKEPCLTPVAEIEIFDPILGETLVVEEVPRGIHEHTATRIAGGRVLIAGGGDANGAPRPEAYLFDPDAVALLPTRALSHPRSQHTATELCDGTVLLTGGGSEDGDAPPSERYNPASRADL
jgi:hypothetical protein